MLGAQLALGAAQRAARWSLALVLIAALAGCATSERRLMPTPHVYAQGHETLFDDVAPALRTSRVPVFFVTDRKPVRDERGALSYGAERSPEIAFGEASVEIGEGLTWDQVVALSTTTSREPPVNIELREIEEFGRTPPTPFPYRTVGGFFEYDPAVVEKVERVGDAFRDALSERLALTSRKEVLVFVHGFNNTFRDAALTLGGMWHFFGREGVPVLYTWPAGVGGLLGYAVDRESGEFTIFHLKTLIRALAEHPEIERMHVLAHSRGTDITATALRELFIESRAAGVDPRERFRIANLIMAAPDLDLGVVQQRLMTEPISPGVGKITVYVSQTDEALGLAEFLFSSVARLGRLQVGQLTSNQAEVLRTVPNVNVIELKGEGGEYGHGYFHSNPAVSSDIFLMTRFNRDVGADNGRPLEVQGEKFYLIRDDYLVAP